MDPFVKLTGIVAPLDRINVDTDQIIPKQFLKRIDRTGFGQFLFFDWRFNEDGSPNLEFVLNHPGYLGASIMVTRRNFGSGSSREHAPWALLDYGFRCIIAPSFADIFHRNAMENGIVPVHISEDQVDHIIEKVTLNPGYRMTVDLESCQLWDEEGLSLEFKIHIDPETHVFRRYCLMNGLDDIGLTLEHVEKIEAFEDSRSRYGGVLSV